LSGLGFAAGALDGGARIVFYFAPGSLDVLHFLGELLGFAELALEILLALA
jgi:hypothetical protein